jgi:hypothetical protein
VRDRDEPFDARRAPKGHTGRIVKPLHFIALARPHYASRLATQVHESLRPLFAYLNAAKRAAKEREARSWVRWGAVPHERLLRLEPLDALLEISVEGYTYQAVEFQRPPADMPMFIGVTFRPLTPLSAESAADGLQILLAEDLAPGEGVFWAGQKCTLRRFMGPTRQSTARLATMYWDAPTCTSSRRSHEPRSLRPPRIGSQSSKHDTRHRKITQKWVKNPLSALEYGWDCLTPVESVCECADQGNPP